LPTTLNQWLDAEEAASNILIAGGGQLADVIRRAAAIHDLGEEQAHALCMDVLGVTARMLAAMLAGKAALATSAEIQSQRSAGRLPDCQVLDARNSLLEVESTSRVTRLPHTWDVTSDSIAALVACALEADELVLLKSCDFPNHPSQEPPPQALAAAAYVDRYFPTAIASFAGRVRMVNLRSFAAD
jgi:5-(aminomethyl)-3-furanmethanol phosphate kinase